MMLLNHLIRQTIAEWGVVEVEGAEIRSGWRVSTKKDPASLEKRVQRWANQNGWSCQHSSQEDVYILRESLVRQPPAA
jgi:hypothetical protein